MLLTVFTLIMFPLTFIVHRLIFTKHFSFNQMPISLIVSMVIGVAMLIISLII